MDVFPGVVDNGNIFWVTSKNYRLIKRFCIVAAAPRTIHPKLKPATDMAACKRPLAVQHHMNIDDYTFHQSYVAQWQSVWPQIMRSAVRITGKPMVLKSEEKNWKKLEVLISVICDMWSWAFEGRSVFNELSTWCVVSVDSCVRKHAKVYGENLQSCFNQL